MHRSVCFLRIETEVAIVLLSRGRNVGGRSRRADFYLRSWCATVVWRSAEERIINIVVMACIGARRTRGAYCAATWCKNFGGCRIDKSISFFRFPRDDERLSKWISFTLREDLVGKTSDQVSSLRLCSDHFHESHIKSRMPRVTLISSAIPTIVERIPYKESICLVSARHELDVEGTVLEKDNDRPDLKNTFALYNEQSGNVLPINNIIENAKTCVSTQVWNINAVQEMDISGSDNILPVHDDETGGDAAASLTPTTPKRNLESSSHRSQLTPRTSARMNTYKRKLSMVRSKLFRNNCSPHGTQRARQKELNRVLKSASKFLSTQSFNIFSLQLKFSQVSKFGRRYPRQYKDFALNLYYHSPRTYRFLRKTLYLPSVTTLLNWQKLVSVRPGVDINTLAALKAKAISSGKKSCVALIIDEISIKEHLQYDCKADSIVGFCNDGLQQTSMIGTHCLVAMVKGISTKWKQTLGYWVTNDRNAAAVKELQATIFNCIDCLQNIQYSVKLLICDQSPHNQALCNKLGVTVDSPFFFRGEEKIFFMFDTPHLLKSIRNNLSNYDFNYNGKVIKWSHFKALFDLVDPIKLRMIPKITKLHVEVKAFKKMKVKLAAQVFSESVSVAMSAYVAMGKLPSEALNTAQFFEDMDKAFDTLNSVQSRKHPYKFRYAISEQSENHQFLELFFKNLRSSNFIGCRRQPVSLKGWLLTINSLFGLCKDLHQNFDVAEICTRNINQDSLENLFSLIRQQHGCSSNPTVAQFSKGYKHHLLATLPKLSPASNCEMDIEYVFSKVGEFLNSTSTTEPESHTDVPVFEFDALDITDCAEEATVYYVAGYLCMHFLKSHVCEMCTAILVENENCRVLEENYQHFSYLKGYQSLKKDFGGLTLPKKEVFLVIGKWESIFQTVFPSVQHMEKVCFHIKLLLEDFPEFEIIQLCSQRITEMFLLHFIRIRVLWAVKFLNQQRTTDKLNILRNHPGRSMLHTMHI